MLNEYLFPLLNTKLYRAADTLWACSPPPDNNRDYGAIASIVAA